MYATIGLILLLGCMVYGLLEERRIRKENKTEAGDEYKISLWVRGIAIVLAVFFVLSYAYHRLPENAHTLSFKKAILECNKKTGKCNLKQPKDWKELFLP